MKLRSNEAEQTEKGIPQPPAGSSSSAKISKKYTYTIREAATYLGISPDTLRNWENQGKLIPKRTSGGSRRYSLSELRKLTTRANSAQTHPSHYQYSIGQAAKFLGVSQMTLRNWEKQGKITAKRTAGGDRRYSFAQLRELSTFVPKVSTFRTYDKPVYDPFEKASLPVFPNSPSSSPSVIQYQKEPPKPIAINLSSQRIETPKTPDFDPGFFIRFSNRQLKSFAVLCMVLIPLVGTLLLSDKIPLKGFRLIQNQKKQSNVLAATTGPLAFAVPLTPQNAVLEINTDVKVKGKLIGQGVLNSLKAGDNVSILDTDPQNPTISVSIPPQSGLDGIVGGGTLNAGTDISIASSSGVLTLADTSTLSSVRGRGGCSGCITSDDLASVSTGSLAGTVGISNGGTGLTGYSTGDILYASATNTLTKLSVGTSGQALVVSNGVPAWGSAGVTSLTGATSGTALSGSITISNSTSSGSTITLDTATTSSKGIASFAASNFNVSSGVVSLAASGVTATNYGSSSTIPVITVNNSGQITAASSTSISISGSNCTDCLLTDPSSTQTIASSGTTTTGLSVKQVASGSVDVFNVLSSDGAIKFLEVNSSGNVLAANNLNVSGTFNSNTFTSSALTFATSNPVLTGTTSINIATTGGTGSILLGGGSGSTGCTVDDSTGNLTCTGSITGGSSSTQGYWSRSGTTLSPANSGDSITTTGNISTTGSGTITSAGLLTASSISGFTLTGNVVPNSTDTLNLGSSSSVEFNNIYAKNIIANGITLSGGTGGFWSRDTNNGYTYLTNATDKLGLGTSTPGAKLDAETLQTSGTLLKVGYSGATTLVGSTTGFNLDLNTNVTNSSQSVTGISLSNPTATNFTGINIGSISDVTSATAINIGNIQATTVPNTGTGGDGSVIVSSGTTNISTSHVGSTVTNSSCTDGGDAVAYLSTANTSSSSTSITLSTTPSSGCLAVGDEVLIIDLLGTSGDNSNVGKYETKIISSISTSTLTFASGLTNGYNGTTQTIVVQRVPQYTNVTVSGGTLTASAYNGTRTGTGILFFRATGTVSVSSGSISMSGNGYAGGAGSTGNGTQGTSYLGSGSTIGSPTNNAGGGGPGYPINGHCEGSGGGGGYGTAGANGSGFGPGTGGTTYGSSTLTTLMLGSGGGSGRGCSTQGGNGGAGGGIIAIAANTVNVTASITSAGAAGTDSIGAYVGDGGGGAGGSILLQAANFSLGNGLVTATGGLSGDRGSTGVGGSGIIATNSTLSGQTTNPANSVQSSSATNNVAIQIGTLTGGATTNYQLSTGALTAVSSSTSFQTNLGAVTGATSATFGGIQTGAISGAGTTSYGINLGANTSTATTNYGINIGALSGAGTTNYGINIGAVSGSTTNYALITNGGLIKNNSTSSVILSNAALGTTATDGFTYIPTSAGTPTGIPTTQTGTVAMEYDTTNNKLMIYNGAWKTTTAFADYVEWAPAPGAEAGDIVTLTNTPNPIIDDSAPFELGKASIPYDGKAVGVVSTYAEDEQIANGYKKSDDYHAIALVGRVPVKVSTLNGPIHIGDMLTTSSIPGVAMKATQSGQIIGKATQDYINSDPNNIGKIIAFVTVSYGNPSDALSNLTLDSSGSLLPSTPPAVTTTVAGLSVTSTDSSAPAILASLLASRPQTATLAITSSDRVIAGVDVITPHLEADTIHAREITADNIQANKIEGLEILADNLITNKISSLSQETQAQIDSLKALFASPSGALTVNQSYIAGVATNSASLAQTASPPGTTFASPSANLVQLSQNLTSPTVLLASDSASLSKVNVTDTLSTLNFNSMDTTVSGKLNVLTQANLPATSIAGDLSVNGTFSVTSSSDGSSLNSLTSLHIQNSPLAEAVDFFNGLVTIDKYGTLTAKTLAISSSTIGEGIIPQGQTQIEINNTNVKATSKIFLTGTSDFEGNLIVSQLNEGKSFIVRVSQLNPSDIHFNYWIVQTAP